MQIIERNLLSLFIQVVDLMGVWEVWEGYHQKTLNFGYSFLFVFMSLVLVWNAGSSVPNRPVGQIEISPA